MNMLPIESTMPALPLPAAQANAPVAAGPTDLSDIIGLAGFSGAVLAALNNGLSGAELVQSPSPAEPTEMAPSESLDLSEEIARARQTLAMLRSLNASL